MGGQGDRGGGEAKVGVVSRVANDSPWGNATVRVCYSSIAAMFHFIFLFKKNIFN